MELSGRARGLHALLLPSVEKNILLFSFLVARESPPLCVIQELAGLGGLWPTIYFKENKWSLISLTFEAIVTKTDN